MAVIEQDNIKQPPHYREGGPPQIVTADTARQGPRGNRVLLILVGSLIAVLVAWAIIEWAFMRAA